MKEVDGELVVEEEEVYFNTHEEVIISEIEGNCKILVSRKCEIYYYFAYPSRQILCARYFRRGPKT